jgi:hypothetical protein
MPVLPGAASTAVRDLLTGGRGVGRVVGVHPACVYVLAGGSDVVAVESADGLGMPCAVRLGADRNAGPFVHVRQGDRAVLGEGAVRAGPLEVRVARWWAPRVPRPPAVAGNARARADILAVLLAGHPAPVPFDAPVRELLGLGPGLTPAGDDVVAGLLVALHHHAEQRDLLAADVARLASARTTALSAALLRQAAAGRAVPAVTALADALAGHGPDTDVARALRRLLAVGSTSGTALAHGLLRGARTVTERAGMKEAVA